MRRFIGQRDVLYTKRVSLRHFHLSRALYVPVSEQILNSVLRDTQHEKNPLQTGNEYFKRLHEEITKEKSPEPISTVTLSHYISTLQKHLPSEKNTLSTLHLRILSFLTTNHIQNNSLTPFELLPILQLYHTHQTFDHKLFHLSVPLYQSFLTSLPTPLKENNILQLSQLLSIFSSALPKTLSSPHHPFEHLLSPLTHSFLQCSFQSLFHFFVLSKDPERAPVLFSLLHSLQRGTQTTYWDRSQELADCIKNVALQKIKSAPSPQSTEEKEKNLQSILHLFQLSRERDDVYFSPEFPHDYVQEFDETRKLVLRTRQEIKPTYTHQILLLWYQWRQKNRLPFLWSHPDFLRINNLSLALVSLPPFAWDDSLWAIWALVSRFYMKRELKRVSEGKRSNLDYTRSFSLLAKGSLSRVISPESFASCVSSVSTLESLKRIVGRLGCEHDVVQKVARNSENQLSNTHIEIRNTLRSLSSERSIYIQCEVPVATTAWVFDFVLDFRPYDAVTKKS